MPIGGINVVLMADGLGLDMSIFNGHSCQRKYMQVTDSYAGNGDVVELPAPGDQLSDVYPNCRVTSLQTYLSMNGGQECARFYLVNYDSQVFDNSQTEANAGTSFNAQEYVKTLLPNSLSTSAIVNTYTSVDGLADWVWTSDSAKCGVNFRITKTEVLQSFTVNRWLYTSRLNTSDSEFRKFQRNSKALIGKINSAEFMGYETGTVLYQGFDMGDYIPDIGDADKIKFPITMKFVNRFVGNAGPTADVPYADHTWNWQFRPDKNSYDLPKDPVGAYLFTSGAFWLLFEDGRPQASLPAIIVP